MKHARKGVKLLSSNRLVIAGTGSGVGKTTLTIGLMAALRKKNLQVQGYKCGPDYIDPSYHTAVTGRPSRNLDSWMQEHDLVKDIIRRSSADADISIIEGVMGLFDGKAPTSNVGSTAEISVITQSPVILVVNCASMARSVAAIVKGFQSFAPKVNIVAVIANKAGSEGHYQLVKTAVEQECHIPVIGYLKADTAVKIPERHLGLIPSIERGELDPFFEKLGELVAETIDLDQLMALSEAPPIVTTTPSIFARRQKQTVKIAVAQDAAFNFYYQENLDLLSAFGAELSFFSPLNDEPLPNEAAGLYLGGGFPEEFAEILSMRSDVKASIRTAIKNGLPTIAECGGFMYLTEAIETKDGKSFDMVGAIPGKVVMQGHLVALGYREITGRSGNPFLSQGMSAKGHEFHYSVYVSQAETPYAYETISRRKSQPEGYMNGNLVAGYSHFYFASCPKMVENWINKCKEWNSR